MNWIDLRIQEVREKGLTELVLNGDDDFQSRGPTRKFPREILELRQLRRLVLRKINFDAIPEAISELAHLEELEIYQCRETELPRSLGNISGLKKFTLSFWDSEKLPFDLGMLQNLEALDLQYYQGALPAITAIGRLSKLSELRLPIHDGKDLNAILDPLGDLQRVHISGSSKLNVEMDALARLPKLSSLGLRHCPLTKRALAALATLSPLQELELSSVSLDQFPQGLADLPRLQHLSIEFFEHPLPEVPPGIASFASLRTFQFLWYGLKSKGRPRISRSILDLPNLECVELMNCDVEGGAEEFFHLPNMKRLSLNTCNLRTIPWNASSPRGLTDLSLSGNGALTSLPEELTEAAELETLWLRATGISTLPQALGKLTKLKRISLGYCPLSELPECLFELSSLEELRLGRTRLTSFPLQVLRLPHLEVLDLSDNPLPEIPPEILRLSRLRNLDLGGCEVQTPPPEIVSQGTAAMQDYFSALAEGPVERLFEAKLLVVGEGEVGKTCLIHKLVDPSYKIPQEKEKKVKSTEGIEIQRWVAPTSKSKDFRMNIWDFGGQEIYHATHQFFLTKRSLYVFVWDARKEDRIGGFDYWLNVVRLLSGGSPVLVVMNKADERIREIDEAQLRTHFPNIHGFLKVSSLDGKGMDVLRSQIAEIADKLPHVGDEWPGAWSQVRKTLEADKRDYISYEEFREICKSQKLVKSQPDTLSEYLHDLGVILHFQDDPVLRQIVILKPEWGTNAVYKVLDTKTVQDAKGRFTLGDLARIWSSKKYPADKHPELLQLMIKFELCFSVAGTADYIAPELLAAEMPPLPRDWEPSEPLRFQYHYTFMPAGIITRFIARMHESIEGNLLWRHGVMLSWRASRALVESKPLDRKIFITLTGEDRRDFLAHIRGEFDRIHKTLNDPPVKEMVPCVCAKCREGVPHLYDFQTLRGYLNKGRAEIVCEKSIESVPIADLLAEVQPTPAAREGLSGRGGVYIENYYESGPPPDATGPAPRKEADSAGSNVRWFGFFVLIALVTIVGLLVFVAKALSLSTIPFVAVGAPVLLVLVVVPVLLYVGKLKEKTFVELVKLSFKQITQIGKMKLPEEKD